MTNTAITWLLSVTVIPALVGLAVVLRRTFKGLGLEVGHALMWPFVRRVRKDISAIINLRRYCRLALATPGTSVLLVPGARESTTLKTDDVFVNLRLDSISNARESYSNSNVLRAGNRIRIIGDPGSGKSSLVKRMFRDACRQGMADPRSARIPIIVELKELRVPATARSTKQRSDWIMKHLHDKVSAIEGHRMGEFFDLVTRQNGILVLFDGLDEVATDSYERVSDTIKIASRRLSELSDQNIVVLTMRTQFHRRIRRDFDESVPATLHVKPFSNSDIFEFLTRWFSDPGERNQANEIYAELAGRPSLRDMCTNPLILAMYTANYREAIETDLPDTRTAFYGAVVEELLVHRRSRQLQERTGRIAKREQRYLIFGRIAFDNLMNESQPANSIDWQAAVEVVNEVMRLNDMQKASEALQNLASETGIISEEQSGETLRFIHLTFCEYFAAIEAVTTRSGGWGEVLDKHKHLTQSSVRSGASRLLEVIPFATALMLRGNRSESLSDVFNLGDLELYARCILETQAYNHQRWPEYVKRERSMLLCTPDEAWDRHWLVSLNLYQTVLAEAYEVDPTGDASTSTIDDLFSELVSGKNHRLVSLFASYATENPAAAFKLADAAGVNLVTDAPELLADECGNPAFLAIALQKASEDVEHLEDWVSILLEAADRFMVVAARLADEDTPPTWALICNSITRRYQWWRAIDRRTRKTRSWYGSILSKATLDQANNDRLNMPEEDAELKAELPYLLRDVRAPGRDSRPTAVLAVFVSAFLALLLWTPMSIVYRKIVLGDGVDVVYIISVGLAVAYTILLSGWTVTYFRERWNCYRALVNLTSARRILEGGQQAEVTNDAQALVRRRWLRFALVLYNRKLLTALRIRTRGAAVQARSAKNRSRHVTV